MTEHYDAIILGAGAAGLMCAISAGQKGKKIIILEKNSTIGHKILISGGGRCNFTNQNTAANNYLAPNPHFCKSALQRYTPFDFIRLLEKHQLTYHEKTLGQLFCDQKSKAIISMLVDEAQESGVEIATQQAILCIDKGAEGFHITTQSGDIMATKMVVATGGPSIEKIGASDFALKVARQFKIDYQPFVPALVPLTLGQQDLARYKSLAGVSHFAKVSCNGMAFEENILFTHRGLSGPAILQISSYWRQGSTLEINLLPHTDIAAELIKAKRNMPAVSIVKFMSAFMAKKLAELWLPAQPLQQLSDKVLQKVATSLHHFRITPNGSEGLKKAEVCTGGVQPSALSQKTFACHQEPNLCFIGEAIDVTGWLGGYNFQWAWSSGWSCGQHI